MKRFWIAAATLASACAANAQLPKFDTQPGKWSYTTTTQIPGLGALPMTFEQCVTQKDIEEGKNLNAQRQAGMECQYSDVKTSGNRYQFTATCKSKDMPEPMVVTYDMTATPTQIDAKMTMTGGHAGAMGGKMNMTMKARRIGEC